MLRRRGDIEGAARILNQLVGLSRASADFVSLGAVRRQLRDLPGARSAYLQGVESEEREGRRNVALRTGLAWVLIDQGEHAAYCCDLLEQSLRLDSESATTHSIVAAAYQRLSRRDGTFAHSRRADALNARADALGLDREQHRRQMKHLAHDLALSLEDLIVTQGSPREHGRWTWPATGTSTGNAAHTMVPIVGFGRFIPSA